MPNAEVLTIGDELLSGETVDTNSSWLDGALSSRGWTVTRHTTVADDVDVIAAAFQEASARADLVISSGGLGPTRDDLTLEALAKALGCELRRDEDTISKIKMMFEALGREMSPNNERQAMVPELGDVVPNPVGTAPGFHAKLNDADVYLFPGVPRELKFLIDNVVDEALTKGEATVARRTLKIIGMGESRLEHSIRQVIKAHRHRVLFGFRALGVENHVKMAAVGDDRADALADAEAALREVLGASLYGVDEDVHSAVIGAQLVDAQQTVAIAESCTGGLAAKLLTDVAGSSRYVLGGVVAYANEVKVGLLGGDPVDLENHGAVSAPVVAQMAVGVRDCLGATWGLSTSGIAGPEGATADKPLGLVFLGIAGPDGVETKEVRLPGDRERVRQSAATAVLDLLRRRSCAKTA